MKSQNQPVALTWREYVKRVAGNERQRIIAERTGVDQTTISRWLSAKRDDKRLSPQAVRAFAEGYERPVMEAYVVAGFLTQDEVGLEMSTKKDLTAVTDLELVQEVHRRMGLNP